ncbi:MAG TPA: YceI family protein [Solirubrobacteraceae bacterium]
MNTIDITENRRERLTAERWELDPSLSQVAFRVRTFWGLVPVRGRFDRFRGHLEVDDLGRRSIWLSIAADSLSTRNQKRDKHLRSADFFDAEHHPELSFRSTGVSGIENGKLLVTGELEVAGESVELELEAAMRENHDELEIDAVTAVDQRRLGMTASPLGMIRRPATLTVKARLHRAA